MQIPNDTIGPERLKELYSNPAARLRSKQADVGLSDLFWYFLCPGPDVHQEHVETGTQLHAMVNEATKILLNMPTKRLEVCEWVWVSLCGWCIAMLGKRDGCSASPCVYRAST